MPEILKLIIKINSESLLDIKSESFYLLFIESANYNRSLLIREVERVDPF